MELTLGYVNLITAFIFAILLGLGIDFSIHFARYREEFAAGRSPLEAMVQTVLHCGSASILAAVTTSCAFAALSIADFRGFSQFGGVAAPRSELTCGVYRSPGLGFCHRKTWVPMKLLGYSVARSEDGDIPRQRFPLGDVSCWRLSSWVALHTRRQVNWSWSSTLALDAQRNEGGIQEDYVRLYEVFCAGRHFCRSF